MTFEATLRSQLVSNRLNAEALAELRDKHGIIMICDEIQSGRVGATQLREWQKALQEYEEPAMDQAVREELEAYVAKRKEEIGDSEP